MLANVVLRVSRSIRFRIGLLLCLSAAVFTVAISSTQAANFSSVNYSDYFCGAPIPAVRKPVQQSAPFAAGPLNVTITGFAFSPQNLTVNVGDTVTWTNNDGTGHTTTSDTGIWSSPVLFMGNTFTWTFTSAGTFPYHCSPHPFMQGSITVVGPSPTPTATATPTPTATPGGASVSGTVTYGNPASPTTKFISNALVASTIGSPSVSTTTAAPGGTAGQYTLLGFGSGNYTIGVTKTTGQNGISSGDAARIAQHVAGLSIIPTARQLISADVTGNGTVASADAAQIARFVAGLGTGSAITNQWRFYVPGASQPTFPVGASPTTRSYTDPIGVQTAQDYIGLLIGEVTGNWNPTAARPVVGPERSTAVNLPKLVTPADSEVIVPVAVSGAVNKGIISYEFDLRYDPAVLQPQENPVDLAGTVSRGLSSVANANEPGLLRVVLYGAYPIEANGLMLNLRFNAVGAPGSVSPLTFERIMFNEGDPRVKVFDGSVELSTLLASS